MRKNLIKFLWLACNFLWLFLLDAEEPIKPCNFFILESLISNEHAQKNWDGKWIEIRGFLYKNENSQMVLAAEPDLKSCCMGSASKRQKQLLVLSEIKEGVSHGKAATLQGNLKIALEEVFPFHLENAVMQKEKHSPYLILGLAGFVIILICFLANYWLRQKNKR